MYKKIKAFAVAAVVAVVACVSYGTMASAVDFDSTVFSATVSSSITLAADNHTVNFGTLNTGTPTAPTSGAPITLTVDSSINYDIKVTAPDFSDGATHTMPVTQLQWKIGAGTFADMSNGLRIVTNHALGVGQTTVLDFQMKAPTVGQASGVYTTTVIFTAGAVGF